MIMAFSMTLIVDFETDKDTDISELYCKDQHELDESITKLISNGELFGNTELMMNNYSIEFDSLEE